MRHGEGRTGRGEGEEKWAKLWVGPPAETTSRTYALLQALEPNVMLVHSPPATAGRE